MKYKSTIAFLLLASAGLVSAEERALGDFTTVTNLWYERHKSNVLAIAEQRLSINSDDLAGLVIRMDYNTAFLNADCFSNDIAAVMTTACFDFKLFNFRLSKLPRNSLQYLAWHLI